METSNNLAITDLFKIAGILILGYVVLMGLILLLFRMLFPAIPVKRSSLLMKRLPVMNKIIQRKTTTPIRKMRMAQ